MPSASKLQQYMDDIALTAERIRQSTAVDSQPYALAEKILKHVTLARKELGTQVH